MARGSIGDSRGGQSGCRPSIVPSYSVSRHWQPPPPPPGFTSPPLLIVPLPPPSFIQSPLTPTSTSPFATPTPPGTVIPPPPHPSLPDVIVCYTCWESSDEVFYSNRTTTTSHQYDNRVWIAPP
ncbi:conserved hypothetical protein [Ricinus communis]|uniref:Uncharacterized protein n=1 Tax=Ricinus communis TaxID=3988 RepID=B9RHL1_RICCO|nr:conserved hypothetical protein [Ricinus communis]